MVDRQRIKLQSSPTNLTRAGGYVFFLAKNDGSDGHAFARNQAEHDANREKYGY